MIDLSRKLSLAAWVVLSALIGSAAELAELGVVCDKGVLFAEANDPGGGRQYAPDRTVDIIHVAIDVTPDFKRRTIGGKTSIRFAPIGFPLDELTLDAIDLTVTSVVSTAPVIDHQVTADKIIITFAEPIEPGAIETVTIAHDAEPKAGLYFRTREMGYKPGDDHLFTQGQPFDARHWFPGFDAPNEKFTSEITCRVPRDMTVISNGALIDKTTDPATGLVAHRWLQDSPHPAYLIALCAGYFKTLEEKHGDLEMAFVTPPSYFGEAANSNRGTKEMMAFFEAETGIKYPWAKYYQVVVDDFVAGGMENTSLTILTTRTLFSDETENIRSSEGLVAHELAHQWFGDYLTCKDWGHAWLNEGFATYYDILYHGHRYGDDMMKYRLVQNADSILRRTSDLKPIVNRVYDNAMEQFSYRSYAKAGWVLHMMRSQLGPDVYRKGVTAYLKAHAHGNVVTEDLNQAMEEASGRTLDRFFDQWVYHGRFPDLEISYRWLAKEKLAKVSVKQTQEVGEKVLLFEFPVTIRFKTPGAAVDREVFINAREHDFYVALPEQPTIVRFDPEYTLLAKTRFNKSNGLLYAQLEDRGDVVGRILACRALASKKDKRTVAALTEALEDDPFYGVRIEASKALQKIHTDEAYSAIASEVDQSDARVRRQVVSDVARFYRPQALVALKKVLATEKNPDILAAALGGLGKFGGDDQTNELIARHLASDSYRQSIAVAAFGAIRTLDDPAYIAPLRRTIEQRSGELTSGGIGGGLGALAHIARNEDDRSAVREFIKGYLNDNRRFVQVGAVRALGTLKDPAAIAAIEPMADELVGRRMGGTVERALKSLGDAKTIPVELSDLREELLELQKKNAELEKGLEEVRKKIEANPGNGDRESAERKKLFGIF